MEIEYDDQDLARLEWDATFTNDWPPVLVRAFRKVINWVRNAPTWPALYEMKSLRVEKLKGDLKGFHSLRMNDQYRLIVKFRSEGTRGIVTVIGRGEYDHD